MHFCWVSIGEVLEIPHKMAIFCMLRVMIKKIKESIKQKLSKDHQIQGYRGCLERFEAVNF